MPYKTRIQVTPINGGKWVEKGGGEGRRGESKWIPSDKSIQKELSHYGIDGIEYKDGYPDFDKISHGDIQLEESECQLGDQEQFKICNESLLSMIEECPEMTDLFSQADIEGLYADPPVTPYGFTWHHNPNRPGSMQLVPTTLHTTFRHAGGRAEWGGGSRNR